MKTKYILVLLTVFVVFTSCSKGFDDRLRGQWQLKEYSEDSDRHEFSKVFYKFSKQVFAFQSSDTILYGQFFQNEDSLIIEFPDQNLVPYSLTEIGWLKNKEKFNIRSLSSKKLELTQGNKYWRFRKF